MIEASQVEKINGDLQANIELLLKALNVNIDEYAISDKQIRGACMCHGSDNKTSWVYYYDNGHWACWTKHCHDTFGNDLLGLIRSIKNISFPDACKFAQEFLKDKESGFKVVVNKKIIKELEKEDPWEAHITQDYYKDDMLAELNTAAAFAKTRGLDYEIFKSLGVGYARKGKLKGRIVVPIRNIEGKIVGFSGRKAYDNMMCGKWMHFPPGLKSKINLFGIDIAMPVIKETHKVIVAESPWDVIKFRMAGFNNAVAMLGNAVHDEQVEILLKCDTLKVILAIHADNAGITGNIKTTKKFEKYLLEVYTIHPDEGYKDFGEMSIGQIKKIMQEIA